MRHTGPGLLERSLDVRNADIEHRVALVAHPSPDAAGDPGPVAGRIAVHEPVVSRLGDRLRDWGIRVELPSEQVTVVAPELLRILPDEGHIMLARCVTNCEVLPRP